jgi:hypothetical protein
MLIDNMAGWLAGCHAGLLGREYMLEPQIREYGRFIGSAL